MSSAVTLAGGVSFKESAMPSRWWRHKTQSSSVGRLTPDIPRGLLGPKEDICRCGEHNNVFGVIVFWPVLHLELNRITIVQRFIAISHDSRKMHEYVLAVLALDEPVALRRIKPLHISVLFHYLYRYSCFQFHLSFFSKNSLLG